MSDRDRERAEALVRAMPAVPHAVEAEDFYAAIDAIARALSAVRAETRAATVEECAKVADEVDRAADEYDDAGRLRAAQDIARAIRALAVRR